MAKKLSAGVKAKVKGRAKTKYAGKSSVRARARLAASKGKTLAQMGGKKTGYSGKGVVKKADLATSASGKKATDLSKKFKGNRAGYVKAQKARTLARQAAKQRHAAAVKRGRAAHKRGIK